MKWTVFVVVQGGLALQARLSFKATDGAEALVAKSRVESTANGQGRP